MAGLTPWERRRRAAVRDRAACPHKHCSALRGEHCHTMTGTTLPGGNSHEERWDEAQRKYGPLPGMHGWRGEPEFTAEQDSPQNGHE